MFLSVSKFLTDVNLWDLGTKKLEFPGVPGNSRSPKLFVKYYILFILWILKNVVQ